MTAPLKMASRGPIYALSGSPHPDTPQTATGKAVAVEAENARDTPERARAAGFPQPAALPFPHGIFSEAARIISDFRCSG